MKEKSYSRRDIVLVRCIIISKGIVHIKARDYQGRKYLIKKNSESNTFRIGEDRSFYAYKKHGRGLFDKKVFIYPLTKEEQEEAISSSGIAGKSLKELGVSLREI